MRNRFFIICVAVIIFNASLNTLVNVNETRKSTDKIESAINESEASDNNAPVINNNITIQGDYNNNTITDSYNSDSSSDTTEVYNNDYTTEEENNTDNNESINNHNNDSTTTETDNSNINPVSVVNETDNNTSRDNTESESVKVYNVILGDPANDINPDDNVVTVKNIKCPKCGSHTYTENYNLKDINLQHYMGRCSTCYYEN